jgi:hypothetical protein
LGAEDMPFSGFISKKLCRALGAHDPETEGAHDFVDMLFHEGSQPGQALLVIFREPIVVLDFPE